MYKPSQDFGDTSMGDSKLSGDIAWPNAVVGQLDDPLPYHVGQRTTVHKDTAQLVDPAMACRRKERGGLV